MTYYDPRKPKPWPVRILNRFGVSDDTKATNIAVAVGVTGIIITIFLYASILGGSNEVEGIPSEILNTM